MIKMLRTTKIYDFYLRLRQERELVRWVQDGRAGTAPHLIKQAVIREYAKKFNIKVLIETGTFLGEMVSAMKNDFDSISSIELSSDLCERARKKFKQSHIKIYEGDSTTVLPEILKSLNCPAIFWLDGHYSSGFTAKSDFNTPVRAELNCIFNHYVKKHIILIDDASCFTGMDDYPALDELEAIVKKNQPGSVFKVGEDIIKIYPEDIDR